MENASKALLIAGGVLLAILVFSLLLFARNNLSDYYASQEEFKDIQDVTKFNKQFTNYERTDVKGYELISLINSVIDYNDRRSTQQANQDQGKPIDVTVDFGTKSDGKQFLYDDSSITQSNQLFTEPTITTYGDTNDSRYRNGKTFKTILENIQTDINTVGAPDDIAKIAKHIYGIFDLKESDPGKLPGLQDNAVRLYNSYITTGNANKVSDWSQLQTKKSAVYHYYEYVAFKKGIFKCIKIDYDPDSGKVQKMFFEFTGEIE